MARKDFDPATVKPDGRPPAQARLFTPTGDEPRRGFVEGIALGGPVTVLAYGTDSVGVGPRLHVHPYDEMFVIVEGRARFFVGDAIIDASAGEIVLARPAFRTNSKTSARVAFRRSISIIRRAGFRRTWNSGMGYGLSEVDLTQPGTLEVPETGDIANWIIPGKATEFGDARPILSAGHIWMTADMRRAGLPGRISRILTP